MRAQSIPQNLFNNFYESLQAVRAAERRLAEANVDIADYVLDYDDLYICPNCQGIITNVAKAYRDPLTDMLFDSRDCADEFELTR